VVGGFSSNHAVPSGTNKQLCCRCLIVVSIGNSIICSDIFVINTTSDISRLLYVISRAVRQVKCDIQHETSIQQVIKDRDVRLWKSIMGTSSHPLQDLLPPLKNRALRGGSHPYQIPRVNTERFKKCFVNRRLFDSKSIVIKT